MTPKKPGTVRGRPREYGQRDPCLIWIERSQLAALDAYCRETGQSRPAVVAEALNRMKIKGEKKS